MHQLERNLGLRSGQDYGSSFESLKSFLRFESLKSFFTAQHCVFCDHDVSYHYGAAPIQPAANSIEPQDTPADPVAFFSFLEKTRLVIGFTQPTPGPHTFLSFFTAPQAHHSRQPAHWRRPRQVDVCAARPGVRLQGPADTSALPGSGDSPLEFLVVLRAQVVCSRVGPACASVSSGCCARLEAGRPGACS